MAIITISREIAALGDETAHELAKILDYHFVDRALLERKLIAYGMTERNIEKYDERKPNFWASLSQERDMYIHFLRTAMFEEAENGNCVFIGRGAMAIFNGFPGVVSVRLVAPYDIRLERVKSYFRCDSKRAKQIIDQSDRDRAGFHRYFFEADWNSPHHYMLTLNMGLMHPATAAGLIKNVVNLSVTPDAEAQLKRKLSVLSLAQKVVTRVLYEKKVQIHFLEAAVEGSDVILQGVANSQTSVEQAIAAAREVPGVGSVKSEIQVVQEYNVMP